MIASKKHFACCSERHAVILSLFRGYSYKERHQCTRFSVLGAMLLELSQYLQMPFRSGNGNAEIASCGIVYSIDYNRDRMKNRNSEEPLPAPGHRLGPRACFSGWCQLSNPVNEKSPDPPADFCNSQREFTELRLRPVVAVHEHEVIRLSPVDPRISRLGQTGVFLANARDPDALDCTL